MISKVKTVKSDEELRSEIIQKAWQDEKFKEALLKDPKGALKKYFQVAVPENISVKAVEETEGMFYLVIPNKPKVNSPMLFW